MRDDILAILSELHPEVDFENEASLVEDKILDSFDIISIVADIAAQIGIRIPAAEITPENFTSLQTICELVEKLDNE